MNVEVATEKIRDMLAWRAEYGVDDIRADIVARGLTSPWQAPSGDKMRGIFPVMIPMRTCLDKRGFPVSVENFGFNPEEALAVCEPQDILNFHFYVMEMKALVLARWSEELDEHVAAGAAAGSLEVGWGSMVSMFVIRDFDGFRLDVLTNKRSRDLIGQIITSTSNYYPELMHGCMMINTPMVFNMVWRAVKPVIAKATQEKISIVGGRFLSTLTEKVDAQHVPEMLGGANAAGYDEQKLETPGGWMPGASGSLGNVPNINATQPGDGAEDDGARDTGTKEEKLEPAPAPSPAATPAAEETPSKDEKKSKWSLAPSSRPEYRPASRPASRLASQPASRLASRPTSPTDSDVGQDAMKAGSAVDAKLPRSTPTGRKVHTLGPASGGPERSTSPPVSDWHSTAEDVDKMLRRALTVVEWQLSQDWVRNELRTNCSLCTRKFTRVFRRHHCRICGEVICGSCSPFRARVDTDATPGPGDEVAAAALRKQRESKGTPAFEQQTSQDDELDPDEAKVVEELEGAVASIVEVEIGGGSKTRRNSARIGKRVRICVKCYRTALAVHMSELEQVRREGGTEAAEAVWADWHRNCRYPSPKRLQQVQEGEAAFVSQQKRSRAFEAKSQSRAHRSAPSSPVSTRKKVRFGRRATPTRRSMRGPLRASPVPHPHAVAALEHEVSYWSDGDLANAPNAESPHALCRTAPPSVATETPVESNRGEEVTWKALIYTSIYTQLGVESEDGSEVEASEVALKAAEVLVNDLAAAFIDNVNDLGLSHNPRYATGAIIIMLFFPIPIITVGFFAASGRVALKYASAVATLSTQ